LRDQRYLDMSSDTKFAQALPLLVEAIKGPVRRYAVDTNAVHAALLQASRTALESGVREHIQLTERRYGVLRTSLVSTIAVAAAATLTAAFLFVRDRRFLGSTAPLLLICISVAQITGALTAFLLSSHFERRARHDDVTQ
jgi:hypothetical protein